MDQAITCYVSQVSRLFYSMTKMVAIVSKESH